jgi:hypothetical protein
VILQKCTVGISFKALSIFCEIYDFALFIAQGAAKKPENLKISAEIFIGAFSADTRREFHVEIRLATKHLRQPP